MARADERGWRSVQPHWSTNASVGAQPILGLDKASRHVRAEIVDMVARARAGRRTEQILLAGEPPAVLDAYAAWLEVPRAAMTTTGLDEGVDVTWNFDEPSPPQLGTYDLVISQAIIEHLVDPFGHLCQLWGLTSAGGALLVHTVVPGFPYHRHPIDCLRFYPDWFEAVGQRLGATIEDRYCDDLRICVVLRRQ